MKDNNTGLYVEENGDGGDCPCRTGVVLGQMSQTNPNAAIAVINDVQKYLEVAPNTYIRFPQIYNQPNDFSRDQASRLMLGLGMNGRADLVAAYYKINAFRHPNGDGIGVGELVNNIRLLNRWWFYPALLLLDVKYLIDIIAYKWQSWDYDNLFVMDLYYSKIKYPTPFAWLARKLYNKLAALARITNNLLNPNNNGCIEAGNADVWAVNNM